jgi:uncharacterized membrane-anchored protein YitT (DUF2179 family)
MARKKSPVFDIIIILIGSAIMTFGLVSFTIPHKIASGGLTGLATVLYHTIGLPVGTVLMIGNLALIALQSWMVGFRSAWKTIISVLFTGFLIDLLMKGFALPSLTKDPILACLYGGILSGIGVGMVFRAGGTTGGVDIIGLILFHVYRIPIGDSILGVNFLITLIAGYAFGPELALYGLITIFFSGKVIDAVLEGISVYRSVIIISKHSEEISWAIMEEIHRGVTNIDGRGMYTGQPTNILLVAVRRMEMPTLRSLVYEFDPDAFMIVGDARQVLGKGFVDLGEQVQREAKS